MKMQCSANLLCKEGRTVEILQDMDDECGKRGGKCIR